MDFFARRAGGLCNDRPAVGRSDTDVTAFGAVIHTNRR